MTTTDILRGARALLADEAAWIHHGPVAVNAEGEPAGDSETWDEDLDEQGEALAPDACAWCLMGALQKSADAVLWFYDDRLKPLHAAIDWPDRDRWNGYVPIGQWNDAPERTHAEVLTALDRAIALAEQA